MITSIRQTDYQVQEAKTPHSLARQMFALLIRRERATYRELQAVLARCGDDVELADDARATWLEARRAAEVARRVLYGWEQ